MCLMIERWPPGSGAGEARRATDMHADRQTGALCRLEDRPVAPAADRFAGGRTKLYLHEVWIAGVPLDLGHRRGGILVRNLDRRLQTRFPGHEFRELPQVDRAAHRRTKFHIA